MKKWFSCFLVLMLFVCSACASGTEHPEKLPGELRVHFVDVGQADCNIIELPNNEIMMIDAGNNDDDVLIGNYLDTMGVSHIDYLVGTHPHEDHIGSMDMVINNYSVGEIYLPDIEHDTKTYRDVMWAIENSDAYLIYACAGTVIYSDSDLKIEVVAPVYYYSDLNDMSLVIRLTYKDSSFLFTGDAEEESENDITMDVSADVLKVGHHGSSTSTSDYFLSRVDPMYAVISCGKDNDYGHPHWETIEKLTEEDIFLYRTDKEGSLICSTMGEKGDYKWETKK